MASESIDQSSKEHQANEQGEETTVAGLTVGVPQLGQNLASPQLFPQFAQNTIAAAGWPPIYNKSQNDNDKGEGERARAARLALPRASLEGTELYRLGDVTDC